MSKYRSRTGLRRTTRLTWNPDVNLLRLENPADLAKTLYSSFKAAEVEEPVFDDHLKIREYRGEYGNGKRNGYGYVMYENGDSYDGSWQNDRRHGSGSYSYKLDGCTFSGEWAKN
jgi:hypothetical protein